LRPLIALASNSRTSNRRRLDEVHNLFQVSSQHRRDQTLLYRGVSILTQKSYSTSCARSRGREYLGREDDDCLALEHSTSHFVISGDGNAQVVSSLAARSAESRRYLHLSEANPTASWRTFSMTAALCAARGITLRMMVDEIGAISAIKISCVQTPLLSRESGLFERKTCYWSASCNDDRL
jgi:hypothetical protein